MPDEQLTFGAGAPDALRWITKQELEARQNYEKRKAELEEAIQLELHQPPEEDGSTVYRERVLICQRNMATAKTESHDWLDKLSRFDKQVDEVKRDNSEKMTRAEVERCLSMVGIYIRATGEAFVTNYAGRVVTLSKPEEAYELGLSILDSALNNQLDSALRENHMPEWAVKAILG